MEAEVMYIAKDGRRFTDALQCEEYEKTIGVIPNSVADVILQLEKHDKQEFIFGIVIVRDRNTGVCSIYTRHTSCCDCVLEDYVNVADILEEKRYITATVGELIETLRHEDKDNFAQYMIVYSKNMQFKSPGIMASHNPMIWK
ncbi:MAG: hypothetical protein IJ082_00590 [Prevotella sp.]|nr:hypothetical protein [Prevotella sp.]